MSERATPAGASRDADAGMWIDGRALSKLRWRCRRGQLENDLFVARFFDRSAGRVTHAQADALLQLMDLSDPDLLDLLLGRTALPGAGDGPAVTEMLRLLRNPTADSTTSKERLHDAV